MKGEECGNEDITSLKLGSPHQTLIQVHSPEDVTGRRRRRRERERGQRYVRVWWRGEGTDTREWWMVECCSDLLAHSMETHVVLTLPLQCAHWTPVCW